MMKSYFVQNSYRRVRMQISSVIELQCLRIFQSSAIMSKWAILNNRKKKLSCFSDTFWWALEHFDDTGKCLQKKTLWNNCKRKENESDSLTSCHKISLDRFRGVIYYFQSVFVIISFIAIAPLSLSLSLSYAIFFRIIFPSPKFFGSFNHHYFLFRL